MSGNCVYFLSRHKNPSLPAASLTTEVITTLVHAYRRGFCPWVYGHEKRKRHEHMRIKRTNLSVLTSCERNAFCFFRQQTPTYKVASVSGPSCVETRTNPPSYKARATSGDKPDRTNMMSVMVWRVADAHRTRYRVRVILRRAGRYEDRHRDGGSEL